MKILPLTLLAYTKAQYGNYGSRMSAAEIYSNQQGITSEFRIFKVFNSFNFQGRSREIYMIIINQM